MSFWFDPMVSTAGMPGVGVSGPALSADQINNSMGIPAVAAQNQGVLDANFNNFGKQTDAYSALGAAYGRATGGFKAPAGWTPEAYLAANPDVASSGMDPLGHYERHGAAEGRTWGAVPSGTVERGWDLPAPPTTAPAGSSVWDTGAPPITPSPAVSAAPEDWGGYFNSLTGRMQGSPLDGAPAAGDSYHPQDPATYSPGVSWTPPAQPSARDLLGYDPNAPFGGGFQNAGDAFDPSTFNAAGYLAANPDVWTAGADPYQHYQQFGRNEGRTWDNNYSPTAGPSFDPSTFNAAGYLAANPDVASSGMDALKHYEMYGRNEGRIWDNTYAPPAADPGFDMSTFNGAGYLAANPDVAASGMDASTHYKMYGRSEGRRWDNNFYDPNTYAPEPAKPAANPSYFDPATFNRAAYLQANPDVAASGMDPLLHYQRHGQAEGRGFGLGTSAIAQPAGDAPSPAMDDAKARLQQGRGWTIAQPVGQDPSLAQNINQSIWDIGQASTPGMYDQWNGYQPPVADHFSDQTQYPGGFGPTPSGTLGFTDQFGNYSPRNEQYGSNEFVDRWGGLGVVGMNAGTPSQYYTGPGFRSQNTGILQPGMEQLPPGFAPPFSADQPRGALPLGALGRIRM
jgi:hypothetical protein